MSLPLYIVYRQVFLVPLILHFESCLDALSLRSNVISSIRILSLWGLEPANMIGGARNAFALRWWLQMQVE